MDKLPTEIHHTIFICLSLEERLKCRLVCRRWMAILDAHSLLYNIEITSRSLFNKFMKKIKCSPYLGNQVEMLKIQHCLPADFNKQRFCTMFPNMRILQFVNIIGEPASSHLKKHKCQSTRSMSNVEKLKDYGHCELARQLITSHCCSRLRYLKLDFKGMWQYNKDFISLLVDMPVLEKLSVYAFEVKIDDFEALHKNVPSIKYLHLSGARLVKSDIPMDIQPATQLIRLKINIYGTANFDWYERWYFYIGRKYTHLSGFDCHDEDNINAKSDAAKQMFKRGLVPFLMRVGSNLNYIYLREAALDINLFKVLDNTGCKLKVLDIGAPSIDVPIFQHIGRSNQSATIEDLVLTGMNLYPISLMENFMSLKKLTIETISDDEVVEIDFLAFLRECPATLEELTFLNTILECYHSPIRINTSIKRLELQISDLPEGLECIFEIAFPNLISLSLKCENIRRFEFLFPNNHLSQIDIHEDNTSIESCDFAITTTEDSKSRYYYESHLISKESPSRHAWITVECASIKQFSFQKVKFEL